MRDVEVREREGRGRNWIVVGVYSEVEEVRRFRVIGAMTWGGRRLFRRMEGGEGVKRFFIYLLYFLSCFRFCFFFFLLFLCFFVNLKK